MDEKINNLETKMDERMDHMQEQVNGLQKEIREVKNQQLLFEHEYGTKIDAIFDAVTLELDKNLEKSQKIRILEGRMDRAEAMAFSYERRISSLELKL